MKIKINTTTLNKVNQYEINETNKSANNKKQ